MGWTQVDDFTDTVAVLLPPVKKQVWDGEKFVPMTLYKRMGIPNDEKLRWLAVTYGQPGTYINGRFWDYSRAGNFTVMDEQVYMWYQMKWSKQ